MSIESMECSNGAIVIVLTWRVGNQSNILLVSNVSKMVIVDN